MINIIDMLINVSQKETTLANVSQEETTLTNVSQEEMMLDDELPWFDWVV